MQIIKLDKQDKKDDIGMDMNKFLSSGRWWISRDGGHDIDGEWLASDSWSGYRKLNDAIYYRIKIYGKQTSSSFGCKPTHWYASLCHKNRQYRIDSNHPSCKSINDALKYADRDLTVESFRLACQWFYSHRAACCVVREDKKPDQYVPFFTSFGDMEFYRFTYFGGGGNNQVPLGNYQTAQYRWEWRANAEDLVMVRFGKTKVDYYGTSGGGVEEPSWQHWLPEIETEIC